MDVLLKYRFWAPMKLGSHNIYYVNQEMLGL